MLVASGVPALYTPNDNPINLGVFAAIAGICACFLMVNGVAVYLARHGWYQAFWKHKLVMASLILAAPAALIAKQLGDANPYDLGMATAPYVVLTLVLPLVTAFFLLCGIVDMVEEVSLRRAQSLH